MDVLQNAITIVQLVQLAVATFQNETKLANSARLLMHSCKLYEDAMLTIQAAVKEKLSNPAFSGKETPAALELQASLKRIDEQISLDVGLLNDILKETEAIKESKAKGGFIRNVFTSVATSRVDNIKDMSNQLMDRFQVISAFMMKDIWKSANSLDSGLMELINDTEGSMFWYGQFGNERQVSFSVFVDSYQSYCTDVFKCRRFQRQLLLTLLRHSLLERDIINDAVLLASEVSVTMFAHWLRRYGPMKDTLSKASAVSNPDLGTAVSWFHKEMSRQAAIDLLDQNLQVFADSIQPHHLFVVRFSADAQYHFVITTRPLNSGKVEHFPVINGPLGYSVLGEQSLFSPNLVECIQYHVLDKLFAKVMGREVVLNKSSLEDWELTVAGLQVELKEDHYKDVATLNEAMNCIDLGFISNGKRNATFGALMGRQDILLQSANVSNGNSILTDTAGAQLSVGEKAVVGSYMFNQGLSYLVQAGQLSVEKADEIRRMVHC